MTAQKIILACGQNGIKLKPLCDLAGIKYGTLHAQMTRGSAIPFETIDAISRALNVPLNFFSKHKRNNSRGVDIARHVVASIEDLIREEESRAGRPEVGQFWDKLHSGNFKLEAISELLPHCDVYEPLSPENRLPEPVQFGDRSLSVKHLKFQSKDDYYRKINSFNEGMVERSLQCHINAVEKEFQVTPEIIHENIDGRDVVGRYLRATARVTNELGQAKTIILTQFVSSLTPE